MKGGGCRHAFIDWSKCVDRERDAGSDFTEECREKTLALRECMLKHEDYYRPMLEEEEEMLREQEELEAAEKQLGQVALGEQQPQQGQQQESAAAASGAADTPPKQ
ncbi:GCK domain-containing [Chlorella sorokiniana]|uniref:GCK domain-containing n=1 Tax=Chlorella sorokiniana TaxID=3076 RepID=A0A2P6TZ29_CHLSO|nr:GCK domain-containing [Chlorella sorokiniana]|eukprot:PRW59327.1 GCK domain-containing [Chlorella sorokiniana]